MRTDKPVIAILGSHDGNTMQLAVRYLNALWRAGAVPVMLPYTQDPAMMADFAALYDGFFFAGGVDVNPALYGEEKKFDSVEIDDERDAFEMGMFKAIYPTGKPIFGICRGIQSLNVFLGGTLYQHIDGHQQSQPGTERPYRLKVLPDSMLYRICGKLELQVNSFHHQNIKTLAPTLVADAFSEDGYIEAVHSVTYPFLLAVQFHPEIYHGQPDDDHAGLIYQAFVDACKNNTVK